jgi:filamentous hemagglutinin family protein
MAGHRISNRSKFLSTSAITLGLALVASNAYALDDLATPTGEVVVGGAATFDRPSEGMLNINQSTDRVVIDWDSFNIGGKATTEFFQPNSGSLAVNRVMSRGSDPTQILGTLKANGQVMVLDRNGVLFGTNAKIDVGGIVASTGDVDNAAVMNGDRKLTLGNFGDGAVVNNGSISVSGAGLAAFVAPSVVNNGVIIAKLGKVALAAGGETATVDLYGDGLVELSLPGAKGKALAENAGTIEGASVAMTASAAKDVVDTVINMRGVIKATNVSEQGGKIVLGGGSSGQVSVTGTLNASGTKGGSVSVTGHDIAVGQNALLSADGSEGDGGSVRLYADNYALFEGRISARGGAIAGNGGFVETSAVNTIDLYGDVDASAANGTSGLWLIDPRDLIIDNSDSHVNIADPGAGSAGDPYAPNNTGTGPSHLAVTHLNTALNAGTDVYVSTVGSPTVAGGGDGTITINANIAKTSGGNATLTMNADGGIGLMAGKSISSNSGFLGLNLTAAKNIIINGTINTNGGNITTSAGLSQTVGAAGIVDAAGGNINLHQDGVFTSAASAVRTTGTGTITLNQNAGGFIQKNISAISNTGTGINTINVGAGTYAQDLTISTANITLNGARAGVDGNDVSRGAGETIITPVTNGIRVLADNATIDGFTVIGGAKGVYVNGGANATVKNTIVSGSIFAGIGLLNANAATLSGNVVHNTLDDAYHVSTSNNLTMSGNSAYSTGGDGIEVWTSDNAVLTGNFIGSTTDGVSKGDSNIARNGILISSSDDATLKGNTVQQAKSLNIGVNNGIYILSSDNAVVGGLLAGEANTVKDVSWDGIKLDHADNAQVVGNNVSGTDRVNIYANYATNSTIDGNTVTDANLVGAGNIWVNHGSDITVSNNTVSDGVDSGIQANDVDGVIVENNVVTNSDGSGINIQSSSAVVNNNEISGSGNDGILAQNSDDIKIKNNTIDNSDQNGIEVDGGTDATIKDNVVSFSGNNGIYVSGADGQTIISGNQVYLTGWNGVYVDGGETATVSGNLIVGAGNDGISVQNTHGIDGVDGYSVRILDNKIALTQRHGIDVENASATKIDGNQIALAGTAFEGWLDAIFSDGEEESPYDFTLNWGNGDGIHVDGVQRIVAAPVLTLEIVPTDETPTEETPVINKPSVVITHNDIKWTGGDGIEVRNSGSVRISHNTVDSTGINTWSFNVADIFDQLDGLDEETVIADGENALFGDGNLVTFLAGVLPTPANVGWGYSDGIHVENVSGDFGGSTEGTEDGPFDVADLAKTDFDVRISKNNVSNTGGDGIEVRNSGWSLIRKNTVDNTGLNYGSYAEGAGFKGDDFEDSSDDAGDGIRVSNGGLRIYSIVDGPSDGTVTRISSNTVTNTGDDGIEVYDVGHSLVRNNTVTTTGSNGILITNEYQDDPTVVIGNIISDTGDNGILISGVDDVKVKNNTVWNTDLDGVRVVNGTNVLIAGNFIGAERVLGEESSIGGGTIGGDGIHVYEVGAYGYDGDYAVQIKDNVIDRTGDDGIEVLNSGRTLISGNTITNAGAFDGEYLGLGDESGADGIHVANVYSADNEVEEEYNEEGESSTGDFYGYAVDILNNTVNVTGDDGIEVANSGSTLIEGNTVSHNGFGHSSYYGSGDTTGADGIHVVNVYGGEGYAHAGNVTEGTFQPYAVVVTGNTVDTTADDGIEVTDSGRTLITDNTVSNSGVTSSVEEGDEGDFETLVSEYSGAPDGWGADGIHVRNVHAQDELAGTGFDAEISRNTVTNP